MAVLGNDADAGGGERLRRAIRERLIVDAKTAFGRRRGTREHGDELALAVALDAGDADDLTAVDRKADVVEPAHAAGVAEPQPFDAEHDVADRGRRRGRRARAADRGAQRRRRADEVALDHRPHEAVDLVGRRIGSGDDAAVAQHRHAVRGAPDLGELVRHEDDAAAARGDALADLQEPFDLGGQQHRGRLVEDEQPRPPHQALDDLDALALADREVVDDRLRPKREAEGLREPHDLGGELGAAQEAARLAEQQVVDDAQIADEAEVLVHHRDAGGERAGGPGRAIRRTAEPHAAGIGAEDAEDDVAQRRLAGAVLAEQAVDLAGGDVERYAVERGEVAEALADAVDREQRLARFGHQPSSVLILPARIACSASSTFFFTSGDALQTIIADACGPIARPKAL
jgi:hypothetical protein